MKKNFSIAISLAVIGTAAVASFALAAEQSAQVVITTDAPCQVTVLVNYTDPAKQSVKDAGFTTPWTLDTYPGTSVEFSYPGVVSCNGINYNFLYVDPGNPIKSGAPGSVPIIVTGHYSDPTPPVWVVPADFSVEATASAGAVVTYVVSVSDPDDAVSSQSCSPASGSTFPLGTTTVNCTATDTHGNTGTASFNVTVADTTPPTLTLPSNMTIEALNASGVTVTFTASANDAVDGLVAVTCTPPSGSLFPIASTTVNCSATDTHGNTASGSFNVIVVDTTPPILTLPSNMTFEATNASGAAVTFTASATDAVNGPVTVTCSPASGSTFPIGETTVICSATDSRGNTASGSFKVTIVDTTPPTLTLPLDMTVDASDASGATVTFTVSANDAVDGSVGVTCLPPSGSLFPVGMTTVSCSAVDTRGNTANGSFHVTVLPPDNVPPVLTLPSAMTVEAQNPSGATVTFAASAIDAVDGPVPVTCLPLSGSVFPIGTTSVYCSATDSHSNTASGSFNVTVTDTTPPVLTLPSNIKVTAQNASGSPVSFAASATDLVDGAVSVTCSPGSGSVFPIGMTTVNCSATDSHGNIANGSFTVTVQYASGGKCNGIAGHQILEPINADGSSVFKAGSTVPARFRVCGEDGQAITTPGVIVSFKLVEVVSKTGTTHVNEDPLSTSSGPFFRAGNRQWLFNIDTKNLGAGNTYVYLIILNDGSYIRFQFALK